MRALAAALAVLWALRLPLLKASMWAVVLLLLFSANCFPWYLNWLVPFLAIYPEPALLLWSGLVVLACHVLIEYGALGTWNYSDQFLWLECGPVHGLLLVSGLRATTRRFPPALTSLRRAARRPDRRFPR